MYNINKKPYYVIYTRNVYMGLVRYGFVPVCTAPNPRKPGFVIWLFEDTPELHEYATYVINEAKNGRDWVMDYNNEEINTSASQF